MLESFSVRRGSGGKGKWKGGDGTLRKVRFLEEMEVSLLTGHRRVPPFGLAGGAPGEVGENWCRRADGRMERLEGCDQTVLEPGDAIIIKTPAAADMARPGAPEGSMRLLPYFLFIAAIGSMLSYHWGSSPAISWMSATLVLFFLGLTAIAWGVNELNSGKALVYNYMASRTKRPRTFWMVILVFRFGIGAALLAAAAWRLGAL